VTDVLADVRTPVAISPNVRVERGQDRTLHVLVGPVTLHVERHLCEELATTLAVAMVRLYDLDDEETASKLHLVASNERRGRSS
jgi:hypothetical protein